MNTAPPSPDTKSEPKVSSLAKWSCALGVSSIFCLVFTGIPAMICGLLALARIKRSKGSLTGNGQAIAGLVIGSLITVLFFTGFGSFSDSPTCGNFLKERARAQRKFCTQNLQKIDAAKQKWAEDNKNEKTGTPKENDLKRYLPGEFPKCPSGGHYTLNSVDQTPTCSIADHRLPAH